MRKRAVGIVRVSRTRGREGDSFASPSEQAERIQHACEREKLTLLRIVEELDVSGGADLKDRPGLGPAVQAVEAREADVIVAAYFDRFFRDTRVQAQVLERVEAAGGRVLAVDVGHVSTGSAGQWLSATLLGTVSEYYRRSNAERVRGALQAAIRRGVAPYGRVPAGYERREDGVYAAHPQLAPVVRAAFERRAVGATVDEVWKHLAANGIGMTYGGAYHLLQSRVYLGELHFGGFEPNLTAHPPIVDRPTWDAVQRVRVPTGRKPKSDRLLARLGILRCATCGSRLAGSTATGSTSVGGGGGRTYAIYRCGNKACPRPVSIMATRVEAAVTEGVRAHLADVEGRASLEANAREAEGSLERAQDALDAAVSAFEVLGDELSARAKLVQLRDARDAARERVERLGGQGRPKVASVDDWDVMTMPERRALIRATVERAVVSPGRGERVSLFFFE